MPWDFGFLSDVSGWTVAAGLGLYVLRKFTTRKWVTDVTLKEAVSEKNVWRDAALTALSTGDKAADVLTDAVRTSTTMIQALEVADDDDD